MAGICITGTTKILAVIGDPIQHSLSPLMHNAALAAMGLDYVYIAFPVKGADLPLVLDGLRAIDLVGFNITIPHKQAIMSLLVEISPLAQAVGAVNTACLTPQGWMGTNTDVGGFMAPLRQRIWQGRSAVVLGYGGAARAVVAGLWQLGFSQIQVVGRNSDRLQEFQASWQAPELQAILQVHPWDHLPDLLPQAHILVNTTPIGMAPHGDQSPLSREDIDRLPAHGVVYDLIYTPTPTRLLTLAQDRGLQTLDGLEMLVQQGAEALRLWVQQPVPVEVMRNALRVHLGLPLWS
jgi:shikimate dehydrogenase